MAGLSQQVSKGQPIFQRGKTLVPTPRTSVHTCCWWATKAAGGRAAITACLLLLHAARGRSAAATRRSVGPLCQVHMLEDALQVVVRDLRGQGPTEEEDESGMTAHISRQKPELQLG